MQILVTGGAGFIGSHVAGNLANMRHRVTVLDDLSGGSLENVPQGCEFVRGDIADDRMVNDLFESHKFELVYHLAAYAAEGPSHFIRRYHYTNNLIGSVTLLNAAIRHATRRLCWPAPLPSMAPASCPWQQRAPGHCPVRGHRDFE